MDLTSLEIFQEHVRANIQYPIVKKSKKRFYTVPLELVFGDSNALKQIDYYDSRTAPLTLENTTNDEEFIKLAKNIVKSYDHWNLERKEDNQIEQRTIVTVDFNYHLQSLTTNDVTLNPDKNADLQTKGDTYKRTVLNKFGCDGVGRILAIIDEKGIPTDLDCFHTVGKTNKDRIIKAFLELGKWNPAIKNGAVVKSQIEIVLYT